MSFKLYSKLLEQHTDSLNTSSIKKQKLKSDRSKESLINKKQQSSLNLLEKNKTANQNSYDSGSAEEEFDSKKKFKEEIESKIDKRSCYNDLKAFKAMIDEEKIEKKDDEQLILDDMGKGEASDNIVFDFSFDIMKNYKFYFKHNNPEILITENFKKSYRKRKSFRNFIGKNTKSSFILRTLKFPSSIH